MKVHIQILSANVRILTVHIIIILSVQNVPCFDQQFHLTPEKGVILLLTRKTLLCQEPREQLYVQNCHGHNSNRGF